MRCFNEQEHQYEDVAASFSRYIHNQEDVEKIHQAFLFADQKHQGQLRVSGKPYVSHLLEVAYILTTLQAGPITLMAGFLHDTVEDCDCSLEELTRLFGKDVAMLVEAVTKIRQLSKKKDKEFVAEGHRKIFIAMAKDIRVIIIKLADRLHNMRTLHFMTSEKQMRIAKETLEVYAPIAHRLGINTIKSELEDLSLYYLERDKYEEIAYILDHRTVDRQKAMLILQKKIADMLIKTNIPFEITSRVKDIYSIYKKMYIKNRKIEEIYDIMAIRIITETELNCYEVLGYIHSQYKPIPGRFKDYIAMPKPNMYQSLHTTIVSQDGNIFEIQIRTHAMNDIAESGIAAHWRYKEGTRYDARMEQKEIEEKLHWFRDLVNISDDQERDKDALEYMASLQHDIFDANVYVFTPLGKVVDLPNGSTPIDFAYKIHSRVGDSAIGALINNTLVPLSTALKTGDVVEIKTSKTSPGPNEGWLRMVKTNLAKSHIRKYLIKKNQEFLRQEAIQKGKQLLVEGFKECGISEKDITKYIDDKLLARYSCTSMEDLYFNVAQKNPAYTVIIDFLGIRKMDREQVIQSYLKRQQNKGDAGDKQAILVHGVSNIKIALSPCCTPIPGDPIVGFITRGQGIKVHRKDCPNVQQLKTRLIDVEWNPNVMLNQYPVNIEVSSCDRNNLLIDILNVFSQQKITTQHINAKVHPENSSVAIDLTILVTDSYRLRDIFTHLQSVEGVYEVKRIIR